MDHDGRDSASLIDLRVDALAYGGDGLGRDPEGRVVFVPYTAPGDRAMVRRTARFERHDLGMLESLVEPGPDRRAAPCPLYGRCGGCQLQHLNATAQRREKASQVGQLLRRIGGLRDVPMGETSAGDEWGYRRRARLRVARREGRLVLGFFEPRSHRLVEVDHCALMAPDLAAAHRAVQGILDDPVSDWEARLPGLSAVTLTLADDGLLVAFDLRDELDPAAHAALGAALLNIGGCRGGRLGTAPFGEDTGTVHVAGTALRVGARAFVQIHAALNERLVGEVLGVLAPLAGRRILDLYAGGGNFSGPLAAGGAVVTAVESDGDAFADLEDLVARAGGRIHAIKADAAKWVRRAAEAGERFDAVLLDPPRPGAKGLAPWIARLAPETVVFVSCDPSTLARDLGAFRRHGYETTAVRPYDFFPQTYHVETLSVLARSSQEPASGD